MQALRSESKSLPDVLALILDKGIVINADIAVSVAGVELLGIAIRAAIASFETAAKYGLQFPAGTNLNALGWREADKIKVNCPRCGNALEEKKFLRDGCSICGWESPHKITPVGIKRIS